jgi:hypothetical protein
MYIKSFTIAAEFIAPSAYESWFITDSLEDGFYDREVDI